MLDPNTRLKLLAQLRPPEGYALDYALGTTFSMDLLTLLITPVSMVLFEHDAGWEALANPSILLEALRRTEGKVSVFCQKGRIKVPTTDHKLLAYLEKAVNEIDLGAKDDTRQGVFHPKVWVLRFLAPDQPIKYRVICLSKNITFDDSWDTALILDGEYQADRQKGYSNNKGLSEFVSSLPELAALSNGDTRKKVKKIADELLRVAFEVPEPFSEVEFIPIGIPGAKRFDYSGYRRVLCVSPFLNYNALAPLTETGESVLISRPEALLALGKDNYEKLARTTSIYTLASSIEEENDSNTKSDNQTRQSLRGLHAKLFIGETGWDTHVFTGSANATYNGLSGKANVEILAKLTGRRAKCGIDSLMEEGDKNSPKLWNLLEGFTPNFTEEPDEEQKKIEELDKILDSARRLFCRLQLRVDIAPEAEGLYASNLAVLNNGAVPAALSCVDALCRPINMPTSQLANITLKAKNSYIKFSKMPEIALSSFFTFTLKTSATVQGKQLQRETSFVLNLPTVGMPDSRHQAIMRNALSNKGALLQYLLFLLAEDPEKVYWDGGVGGIGKGGAGERQGNEYSSPAILEEMVRAFSRNPGKMERLKKFISEYGEIDKSDDVEKLNELWPVFEEAMKEEAGDGY